MAHASGQGQNMFVNHFLSLLPQPNLCIKELRCGWAMLWVSQLFVSHLDNVSLLFLPTTHLAKLCNVKSESSYSRINIQTH